MELFGSHIRATNDPNHTGTRLPFKEGSVTNRLLHAIDCVLRNHANKPSNLTWNSVNVYDANIPTSFIQTVKQQQQLPHLDYHHSELKLFEAQTPICDHITPWSMGIPHSSGGFFLCDSSSYDDYTIRLKDGSYGQFANPLICVCFFPKPCSSLEVSNMFTPLFMFAPNAHA